MCAAFGNAALRPKAMPPIDAAAVTNLRKQKGVSAEQVFATRKKLKAGAKK